VRIRLDCRGACRVYALSSSGRRRFEVPCRFEGGILHFKASVRGADGFGVIEYEVCTDLRVEVANDRENMEALK